MSETNYLSKDEIKKLQGLSGYEAWKYIKTKVYEYGDDEIFIQELMGIWRKGGTDGQD